MPPAVLSSSDELGIASPLHCSATAGSASCPFRALPVLSGAL